jgi:hypothetical protein
VKGGDVYRVVKKVLPTTGGVYGSTRRGQQKYCIKKIKGVYDEKAKSI